MFEDIVGNGEEVKETNKKEKKVLYKEIDHSAIPIDDRKNAIAKIFSHKNTSKWFDQANPEDAIRELRELADYIETGKKMKRI